MRRGKYAERGYLLMEALMAMALLATGLCACIESFRLAHRVIERANRQNNLTNCNERKDWQKMTGISLLDQACEN